MWILRVLLHYRCVSVQEFSISLRFFYSGIVSFKASPSQPPRTVELHRTFDICHSENPGTMLVKLCSRTRRAWWRFKRKIESLGRWCRLDQSTSMHSALVFMTKSAPKVGARVLWICLLNWVIVSWFFLCSLCNYRGLIGPIYIPIYMIHDTYNAAI